MNEPIAPIADLDAEGAILGTALVAPECVESLQSQVCIEDFYSVANQLAWRAIVSCHATGTCSIIGVRAFLVHHQRAGQVPIEYLASLTMHAVKPSQLQPAVESLRAKAKQRRLVAIGQHVAATASLPDADLSALVAEATASLANDNDGRKAVNMWPDSIPIADYFTALPPVPWVCRDLCICPGRPTMLAGYGFSGKTIACLSLAIQIATGRPAFGQFRTQQGRVIHLDHEQGTHGTRRRIQRLCLANGIQQDELSAFEAKIFPKANLTTEGFEGFLRRALEGVSLCSFDSLRAITPGVDENDSKIREHLDILTRVSEATGCAFLVIHHDGKGGKDKEGRETMRGSSAIFDACGTVLSFEAKEPGDPIKVTARKTAAEAEGAPLEPFYLRIEDVPEPNNQLNSHWGLRMIAMSEQQVNQPMSPQAIERRIEEAVIEYVRSHDGAGDNEIVMGLKGVVPRDEARAALLRLDRLRKLVCTKGSNRKNCWSVSNASAE